MAIDAASSLSRTVPARPAGEFVIVTRRALELHKTRIGLVITVLVVLAVVFGPSVSMYDPDAFVSFPFAEPSAENWLGTDSVGRDVLSRLLAGGTHLLVMSLVATILGVGAGTIVGLIASSASRRVREIVMWLLDVLLAFPQVVLALLFLSMLGSSPELITGLVALAHLPRVARMADALSRVTVNEDFIKLSLAQGVPPMARMLKEIAPNIAPVMIIECGLRLTWSTGMIAALGFLGLGVQPPAADWGLMINENRVGLALQPWATIAPTIMIAVFAIGTNLVAEGFSAALTRERPSAEA